MSFDALDLKVSASPINVLLRQLATNSIMAGLERSGLSYRFEVVKTVSNFDVLSLSSRTRG